MEKIFLILSFISFNSLLILNFSKIKIFHTNIDKPDNLRKKHKSPTPLAGGLIIILNLLVYFCLINFSNFEIFEEFFFQSEEAFNIFFLFALIIFFVGFFDDKFNLSANLKFISLTILIVILLFLDENLQISNLKFSVFARNFYLDNYSVFFTVFCFLVYLNAFNMFDGINLQSSIYSLIIFFYISIFFENSTFLSILIISLIFFCYLNYKNKSFLGDSGSLLLGFIISYIFIKLYNLKKIEFADDIVIFMIIPGIDLLRLFIIRLVDKRNPLSSDRLHLHHLLINKFNLKQSIFIIIFLIIFPVFLNYLNINNFINILVTIFLYFGFLMIVKKKI